MAMTKQQMIDALNEDLAYEYAAVLQYLTYAAKVSGPYRPELSRFFMAEVPAETAHAQWLANKIVSLGGEPTDARGDPRGGGGRGEAVHHAREAGG
jgi:bacterioferritin